MDRQRVENYLNNLTAFDGDIEILTNIRDDDYEKLYLCDKYFNVNADILTAFLSPIDIDIEIIVTQNVIDIQPNNEYSHFSQSLKAGIRTAPICGYIILCSSSFTMIYIKSENKHLKNLKCYGLSFDNIDITRILKRHTILVHKTIGIYLQYENGFLTCYQKNTNDRDTFQIIPNPYYS
jgi:hypothetical protein